MKKILAIIFLLVSVVTFSQQSGTRYTEVPEGGGPYQVPNKEIKTPSYASTLSVTTTHEETILQVGTLTGALTINGVITNCYKGDKLYCQFAADASNRIVTFGTNFDANGTLTVVASSYASAVFMFNGAKWFEVTRQNLNGAATTLLAGAGSAAVPSISFSAQNDLGLYKVSSTELGFTASGTKTAGLSTTGLAVTGLVSSSTQFNSANGTVSAPGVSFSNDLDCGLYRIGANNTGFAENGAKVLDIATTGLGVTGLMTATTSIQAGTTVITDAITEKTSGSGITMSKAVIKQGAITSYTTTATVTAAELAGGIIKYDGAGHTLTLPTATQMGTQISATAGTVFDFVLLNINGGSGTATIAVGTNIVAASAITGGTTLTLAASATVGTATFRLTFLSATAATISRIN